MNRVQHDPCQTASLAAVNNDTSWIGIIPRRDFLPVCFYLDVSIRSSSAIYFTSACHLKSRECDTSFLQEQPTSCIFPHRIFSLSLHTGQIMGHGDSGYSGSSSSSSNSSSTSSASSSSSTYSTSTSKSAKAAYHAHDKTYPYEVWYIVAGFIFICGVVRIITTIHACLHRRGYFHVSEDSVEEPRRTRAISLRRLHLAAVNAYRIVAFRCIVPLGAGYTLNVAEVVLTAVYTFIMMFFTFVSCEFSFC